MSGRNGSLGEDAPCWVCAVVDDTGKTYRALETPRLRAALADV